MNMNISKHVNCKFTLEELAKVYIIYFFFSLKPVLIMFMLVSTQVEAALRIALLLLNVVVVVL